MVPLQYLGTPTPFELLTLLQFIFDRNKCKTLLHFINPRCKYVYDIDYEKDDPANFVRVISAAQDISQKELFMVKNSDIKKVLQYGLIAHQILPNTLPKIKLDCPMSWHLQSDHFLLLSHYLMYLTLYYWYFVGHSVFLDIVLDWVWV